MYLLKWSVVYYHFFFDLILYIKNPSKAPIKNQIIKLKNMRRYPSKLKFKIFDKNTPGITGITSKPIHDKSFVHV